MNIEIGSKKIDFVYQGDNLIYPNYPARENLILHYDFSGMKNSDVTKAIARDLSGNGNNGVLQNFAYTNESGYLDNELIFDGIDDFITIPESQIDLNNFTYSEGAEVIAFRGDEVATVVDGVVEIGGRNLLPHSDFSKGVPSVLRFSDGGKLSVEDGLLIGTNNTSYGTTRLEFKMRLDKGVYTLAYKGLFIDTSYWGAFRNIITQKQKISYVENTHTLAYLTFEVVSSEEDTVACVYTPRIETPSQIEVDWMSLVRGNKPMIDWTPAPEDLETTTFKPLFDKKIKSALYWNRALTDKELLQVYNTQINRI